MRVQRWGASLWAMLLEVMPEGLPLVSKYRSRMAAVYRQLGVQEYAAGSKSMAVVYFKKALRLTSRDPGLRCDLGQIYYQTEDLEEAERQFRKALKYDPSHLRALKALGIILQQQQKHAEAVYFYLRYLEQNAHDVEVLINVGAAFYNQGNYEQALRYCGRAQKLAPNNPILLENRARSLYALGKIDQAIATMHRSLELSPSNSGAQRFLSQMLEANGKPEEALSNYKAILEHEPDNATIHLEVAHLLEILKRYNEAIEHCLHSLEISGRQSSTRSMQSAYWLLGWLYYRTHDLERSIEYSQKAVMVNPKLFPARFNLALALVLQGRANEALAEYEKGIAELSQASDLKYYAIDDLAEAVAEHSNMPEGLEILDMLRNRYESMRPEGSQPRILRRRRNPQKV